jgi:hypothetical protein
VRTVVHVRPHGHDHVGAAIACEVKAQALTDVTVWRDPVGKPSPQGDRGSRVARLCVGFAGCGCRRSADCANRREAQGRNTHAPIIAYTLANVAPSSRHGFSSD